MAQEINQNLVCLLPLIRHFIINIKGFIVLTGKVCCESLMFIVIPISPQRLYSI